VLWVDSGCCDVTQDVLDVVLPDPLEGVVTGLLAMQFVPFEIEREEFGYGSTRRDSDRFGLSRSFEASLDDAGLFHILDFDGQGEAFARTLTALRIIVNDEPFSPASDGHPIPLKVKKGLFPRQPHNPYIMPLK
jgi:hypothetical protein